MVEQIEFKTEAVLEVERDFSKLQLIPVAKQVVAASAQLYAKFLPISELAMKGFIAMAMRDFQIQEKVDASILNQFPKEKMLEYMQKMEDILRGKLEKVLLRPEQKPKLREAIQKAHEFALKWVR